MSPIIDDGYMGQQQLDVDRLLSTLSISEKCALLAGKPPSPRQAAPQPHDTPNNSPTNGT